MEFRINAIMKNKLIKNITQNIIVGICTIASFLFITQSITTAAEEAVTKQVTILYTGETIGDLTPCHT